MKQSTTDRLVGMVVTLIAGIAIVFIQHRLVLFVKRRRPWKFKTKKATDYGDPFFRARWGKEAGAMEVVEHRGRCGCGRFSFRVIAPSDLKALDCPGRVRYPHIFVPATAFQPLSDLRVLTLYTARSALSHVVVHAFCSKCGVPIFRASDGAVDTIIVNVDCLDGASITSMEVAYYEDLVAYPMTERARTRRPKATLHQPSTAKEQDSSSKARAQRQASSSSSKSASSSSTSAVAERRLTVSSRRAQRSDVRTSVPIMSIVLRLLSNLPGPGSFFGRPETPPSVRRAGPWDDERGGSRRRAHSSYGSTERSSKGGSNGAGSGRWQQQPWEEDDEEEDVEEGQELMVAQKESALWRGWAEACRGVQRPHGSRRRGASGAATNQQHRASNGSHHLNGGGQVRQVERAAYDYIEKGRREWVEQEYWAYEDEENCEPPSMDQLRYHLKRHLNGDAQQHRARAEEGSLLPLDPPLHASSSQSAESGDAPSPLQDKTARAMSEVNMQSAAAAGMGKSQAAVGGAAVVVVTEGGPPYAAGEAGRVGGCDENNVINKAGGGASTAELKTL